jgi:hypothetical protein
VFWGLHSWLNQGFWSSGMLHCWVTACWHFKVMCCLHLESFNVYKEFPFSEVLGPLKITKNFHSLRSLDPWSSQRIPILWGPWTLEDHKEFPFFEVLGPSKITKNSHSLRSLDRWRWRWHVSLDSAANLSTDEVLHHRGPESPALSSTSKHSCQNYRT